MAEKVIIEVEVDASGAKKAQDGIKQGVAESEETLNSLGSSIDGVTGGLYSGMMKGAAGIKTAVLGFKTLRGAIAATGLGALLLILSGIVSAFKSSEEGQNKYAKMMSVLGAIVGNLNDLLADFGELVISAVENPRESILAFGDLLKKNITNRFEGLVKLIPSLGQAVQQLFKGNFSEAGKIAVNAVAQVTLGVKDMTDKIENGIKASKDFVKQNIEEGKAAAKVADMRAKADKIERDLLIQRSELENEIAELRLKSRQEEQYSAEERKQALLEAQELEDILLEKETTALKLRAEAQTMENTFARSNKENLDEEAELIARVNRQKAARTNQQRQTQRELNRLNKEIAADQKRIAAEEKKAEEEKLKRIQELAKVEDQERRKLLEASLSANELELLLANEKYDALIKLAEKHGEDVTAIEQRRAETVAGINKKYAAEDAKQEQDKQAQKVAAVMNGLATAQNIIAGFAAGNEARERRAFEINKRIQQAQAVIAALQSANNIFAATSKSPITAIFPAYPYLSAAGALGAGLANARQIGQQSYQGGGASSGGAFSAPAISAGPSASTVGDTPQTQIAQAVTGTPQRSYVVSSDVTSGQALDRKILTNAQFG